MIGPATEASQESADSVFYEVAMQRLQNQWDDIDAADGKITTAYSGAAAILAFYGVILTLGHTPDAPVLRFVFAALLAAALVFYCALFWHLYRAFQPRSGWDLRPDLATLRDYVDQADKRSVQYWVASECANSIVHNDGLMATKSGHLKAALALLPIEAVLLALVALTTLSGR